MGALGSVVLWRGPAGLLALATFLGGCAITPEAIRADAAAESVPCQAAATCARPMAMARTSALRAEHLSDDAAANRHWLACAEKAYVAAVMGDDRAGAVPLANRCTDQLLRAALRVNRRGWTEGRRNVGGIEMQVTFHGISPNLPRTLELSRAADVSMAIYDGQRHARIGFGVPLVATSPRCVDRPACALMPAEGVFRAVTAWVEPAAGHGLPVLVIGDPDNASVPIALGALSVDRSAAYALGARASALNRQGVWGLLGGKKVGLRAGVYLLEDYDPNRRPVVMIHGLGSSPLIWAKTSNAIWGDPLLRQHFQVWHVVYQTNAPLLITRRRIQTYLDAAWRTLDPEGDDPARQGMVLVGHSMGGVVARLLSADSGEVLWSAAFNVPLESLQVPPADRDVIRETFLFSHYPGVDRAIFLAAPHRGAPAADGWLGRVVNRLVGRRAPELKALVRLAEAQPTAVREELRESYLQSRLNSIVTLRVAQPVRRAGESLMPHPGVSYHTIAGVLIGEQPPGDGSVPLDSALLPAASSTLVIYSDHYLYQRGKAIDEVVRILQQAAAAGR